MKEDDLGMERDAWWGWREMLGGVERGVWWRWRWREMLGGGGKSSVMWMERLVWRWWREWFG